MQKFVYNLGLMRYFRLLLLHPLTRLLFIYEFSNDDSIIYERKLPSTTVLLRVVVFERASFASSRRSFGVVGGKLRLSPLSSSRHNLRGRSFTPSRS